MNHSHVHAATPMGAQLVEGGATFRTWAPNAKEVYVVLHDSRTLLIKDAQGYWAGFIPGVADGAQYRFGVVGVGSEGFKRDPCARELEMHGYPDCDCSVRDPDTFPWRDQDYRPPAFNDLIIYQFHIGVFFAQDDQGRDIRPGRVSKYLDVVDRIKYLADR